MTSEVTNDGDPLWRRGAFVVWCAAVLSLAAFGLPRVVWRHYHVDEFNNAYNMKLLGALDDAAAATNQEPWLVAFGWVVRGVEDSADTLLLLRLAFFAGLVAVMALVASLQTALPSPLGRASVFLAATTSVPLWRHGFEVRHDLLLAIAALLVFGVAVRAAAGLASAWLLAAAGVVAATAQMNGSKAAAFLFPALLIVALNHAFAGSEHRVRRGVQALALIGGGGVLGLSLWIGALFSVGLGEMYLERQRQFLGHASTTFAYSWAELVATTALSAPLSAALTLLVLAAVVRGVSRRTLTPSAELTAVAFLGAATLALAVNPTPFSYNITWYFPFVLLTSAYGLKRLLRESQGPMLPAVVAVAWALTFLRGYGYDASQTTENVGQLQVIRAAELLTARDEPVLDGAGVVLSRPPPTPDWLLHSLFMPDYRAGRRESFRAVIERVAPPVVLPSYRFAWLSREDQSALDERYIPLSNALWVLGARRSGGEGSVRIYRPGRYGVFVDPPSAGASVGGRDVTNGAPLVLEAGELSYRTPGRAFTLVWLGPTAVAPPNVPDLDRGLFVGESPVY